MSVQRKERRIGIKRELTRLLLSEAAGHSVLAKAFELKKGKRPGFSLSVLARAIGMSSKGNLSDFFHGRRGLSKTHRSPLFRALGFEGIAASLLEKQLDRDGEKNPQKRQQIEETIGFLKKALKVEEVERKQFLTRLEFKIFCGLSLFKNSATREDICAYFKSYGKQEIHAAVSRLIELDFIEETQKKLSPTAESGTLVLNWTKEERVAALRAGILEAEAKLPTHMERPDSFFQSSMVSVVAKEFIPLLENFRTALHELQIKANSNNADQIVSINIQIFPTD